MPTNKDDAALVAIDTEWKTGDRTQARAMAKAYVDARRNELAPRFGDLDIPALVAMVTHYRNSGDETNRMLVDTWLLSEHQPQRIGGDGGIKVVR